LQRYDAIMFYTRRVAPQRNSKASPVGFRQKWQRLCRRPQATDTFYQWSDYGEMIGGYFNGILGTKPFGRCGGDINHPATRHLGTVWEVNDEIYQHRNWSREKVRVLLRLDPTSVDITKGKRDDQDYALAWCRQYGKGRVFYTALGHEERVWRDPKFQAHLLGGILWAMGVLPGDATPPPNRSEALCAWTSSCN
jgi:type 1 glutamine amidotransferase